MERRIDDDSSLNSHFADAAQVARGVFDRYAQHALDEQAGPAYLQGFPLSRRVFWQRLKRVAGMLPASAETIVDFGCGFGLLHPLLRRRCSRLVGVDLMPELAQQFLREWDRQHQSDHSDVAIVGSLGEAGIEAGSVDLILALDVLEHVDDLPAVLAEFSSMLRPDGRLIVSGPTENWWYRLGRRMVGFSGDYHVRNVGDIERAMERAFAVKVSARIFYPFTLFHILTGVPCANPVAAVDR